ncbi:MAG: hypothetical protein KDD25_08600, partial [Bdellovibrionales bacterium]|nr:hypothetical protein [Bdellovibrionales bacterium]
LTQVDRVILLFPQHPGIYCGSYIWGTIGRPRYPLENGKSAMFSTSWVYDSPSDFSFHLGSTHEFGHNLGLNHASSIYCNTDSIYTDNCNTSEYGDYVQYMGQASSAEAYYSAAQLEQIGWAKDKIVDVPIGSASNTLDIEGILNISPLSQKLGVKIPLYSWPKKLPLFFGPANIYLDYYNATDSYQRGVYIRYITGSGYTYTPTLYNSDNGNYYLNRRLNETDDLFVDYENGIEIRYLGTFNNRARVKVTRTLPSNFENQLRLVQVTNAQTLFGSSQSCRDLYVDLQEVEPGAASTHTPTITYTYDEYPFTDFCNYEGSVSSNTHRYRCNYKVDPNEPLALNIYEYTYPLTHATPHYPITISNCNEPQPQSVILDAEGNSDADLPHCNQINFQLSGQFPANTPFQVLVYDFISQTSQFCNSSTDENFGQCSITANHDHRYFLTATFENNGTMAQSELFAWPCSGESLPLFNLPFESLKPERIFKDSFESNAFIGNYCSQVTARVSVGHQLSGKTIDIRASDILNPSTHAYCTIQIPNFNSGTRHLSCTFPNLDPQVEHYLDATIEDRYFANGIYGKWSCD